MTNRTYNRIKCFTTVILPIFGSLYFIFGLALGWAVPGKVAGFTLILTTWFSFLLTLLSKNYVNNRPYEGRFVLTHGPDGKKIYNLEIAEEIDLDALPSMDSIRFKVVKDD